MKKHLLILIPFVVYSVLALQACSQNKSGKPGNPYYSHTDTSKLNLSDAEWKKILPTDVYNVSRHKETEQAFTGKFWNSTGKGTYYCAACGNVLFRSDAKFASSCGWPSFFEQKNPKSVVYQQDDSYGMSRLEALCGRCGGHLGHLFDDGPPPTGKRYCMNSIALDFEPDKEVSMNKPVNNNDTITLGGGCFWCVEAVYENLMGVESVVAGFSGGTVANPSYREVCTGNTNHAEVVQIVFNKTQTSLDEIFKVFFTVHDPTTLNKQGDDEGTQYRSVIFYRNEDQRKAAQSIIDELNKEKVYPNPIVTVVQPFKAFYKAEDYHQSYYANNKNEPYCKMVIQPKLEKFEKVFSRRLKSNPK
jgi:peptide methionine sulfoxide reductase msrA/msrB